LAFRADVKRDKKHTRASLLYSMNTNLLLSLKTLHQEDNKVEGGWISGSIVTTQDYPTLGIISAL